MYENDGGLLSPRDAYRLMLKDYPDVMDIGQMCEASVQKPGTSYLKMGKLSTLKLDGLTASPKPTFFVI